MQELVRLDSTKFYSATKAWITDSLGGTLSSASVLPGSVWKLHIEKGGRRRPTQEIHQN